MPFQKIALVGDDTRRAEFKKRLPDLKLIHDDETSPSQKELMNVDLLIDLNLDEKPAHVPVYLQQEGLTILGAALKRSLFDMVSLFQEAQKAVILGINALPTFLDRPVWEVSVLKEKDKELITELESVLGVDMQAVQDQVGMVTPRILFLIINEAYIMMQEGTAEEEAIDTAMKLGTNYPKGPISWSREVGVQNVVEVMEALYHETGSKRFIPSRALKRSV